MHCHRHCVAWKYLALLLATLVTLVLLVAAMPSPWYKYTIEEAFTEYPTRTEWATGSCSNFAICFDEERGAYRSMWHSIFAALILAIAFTTVVALMLFLWTFRCFHNLRFICKLRFPLIVLSGLATLACMAAWALLLWHPHAISDTSDIPFSAGDPFDSGPEAGWYLAIVASALSLLVTAVLPCTGRPEHDYHHDHHDRYDPLN